MREKIENYMENNLKYFELGGVEITEDDFDFVEEKVKQAAVDVLTAFYKED